MKKEYRLIQIIESVDNITKENILIFEMTPVEYNSNNTGYNFNTLPSPNNHFFVYQNRPEIEDQFLTDPENIKTLDLEDFNEYSIKTPEGLRKTFFLKEFDEIRMSRRM